VAAVALLQVSVALAAPADPVPASNFAPWPQSVKATGGDLSLTSRSRIIATDKSLEPLVEIFSSGVAA